MLDSGGYGPVTITQALTIEAPPGVVAYIHPASGDGITVNAGSTDVVILRGLVLNGGPSVGIIVNTVGTLHIENCVISGFGSYGIYYSAANSNLFAKDTIVRQDFGGLVILAGRASIDHCRFEGHVGNGVYVEGADVTVRDSVSAGNGVDGFYVNSFGTENSILSLYECLSTNNAQDGFETLKGGSGFVIGRVANSSIDENIEFGLNNGSGATLESLGNNFVRGNFGGDLNGTITDVAAR